LGNPLGLHLAAEGIGNIYGGIQSIRGEGFSNPYRETLVGGLRRIGVSDRVANALYDVGTLGAGYSCGRTIGRAMGRAANRRAAAGDATTGNSNGGLYSHLDDHPSVGPSKRFTQTQKRQILATNRLRNSGILRSDTTGEVLVQPQQHTSGVTPPWNEAHVHHIRARSLGGSNSYSNAQVISRFENLKIGNRTAP
jgi:hypothetical protein